MGFLVTRAVLTSLCNLYKSVNSPIVTQPNCNFPKDPEKKNFFFEAHFCVRDTGQATCFRSATAIPITLVQKTPYSSDSNSEASPRSPRLHPHLLLPNLYSSELALKYFETQANS